MKHTFFIAYVGAVNGVWGYGNTLIEQDDPQMTFSQIQRICDELKTRNGADDVKIISFQPIAP